MHPQISKKEGLNLYLVLFLVFIFFLMSSPPDVLAANDASALPGVEYFTPDLNASLQTVAPILRLINWAAGIFGLILVVIGIWKTLKIVWQVFTGRGDYEVKNVLDMLKPVLFGIILVLFAITGLWYKFLVFLWTMIVPQAEEGLNNVRTPGAILKTFKYPG